MRQNHQHFYHALHLGGVSLETLRRLTMKIAADTSFFEWNVSLCAYVCVCVCVYVFAVYAMALLFLVVTVISTSGNWNQRQLLIVEHV